MSRPELLPELWIRVFDFLKRDVPPPWKQATWSDFHQEDLTSVCLVSSLFYKLAAPILYHSVVANDLPSLVTGLSAYNAFRTSTQNMPSKDDLVARTKDLRIVGFGPTNRPVFTLRSLLTTGDWSTAELWDSPPFKSLERLVMGQRYDRGWDYLEDRKYTDEQLHDQHVGAFMYAHQPRSVCVHASYGPYGGKNVHLVTAESDTDLYIVTRHQYDLDLVCPQIICGALNRWTVYPGCITDTLVDREDEKRGTEFMEQLVLSTTQLYCVESDTPSLRTKLDIYGHAMTGLARSHLLRKDDIWDDAIEEARTMDDGDRKILEKLCGRVASLHTKFQVEEEGLNDWMSHTLAGLPYQVWDPWLDKIKLRCWRDVPACECCGLTTEAYCEEFDEGLSFIEATHKVMQAMGAIE